MVESIETNWNQLKRYLIKIWKLMAKLEETSLLLTKS